MYNTEIIGNKLRVHAKQINYLSVDDRWLPIDCIIKETQDRFEVTEAPFKCEIPKTSDGVARFINNNRYDVANKTKITDPEFRTRIKPVNINVVTGELLDINGNGRLDAVIYKDAYDPSQREFRFRLTHSDDRPKISRGRKGGATREQLEAQFEADFNADKPIQQDGGFSVIQRGSQGKRGSSIKEMKIWDYSDPENPREEVINASIKKGASEDRHILKKIIPDSFFQGETVINIDLIYYVRHGREVELQKLLRFTMVSGKYIYSDATITISPDAGSGGTTVDGYAFRSTGGEPWISLRTGNGTNSNEISNFIFAFIQNTFGSDWGSCSRPIMSWDIPVNNYIAGTLNVNGKAVDTTLYDGGLVFCDAVMALNNRVLIQDYQNSVNEPLGSRTEYGTTRPLASTLNIDSNNVINLNASFLAIASAGGIVQTSLQMDADFDDNPPTPAGVFQTGSIQVYSADETNPDKILYLELEIGALSTRRTKIARLMNVH